MVEMLVSLVVISILASVALPYAKVMVIRNKEILLKRELRTVREAIDLFHQDCVAGVIKKNQTGISRDCYPKELSVMVEGVDSGDAEGAMRRYLRRLPQNPFNSENDDVERQWRFRSYRDNHDSTVWGEEDTYDLRANSDQQALDDSYYSNW